MNKKSKQVEQIILLAIPVLFVAGSLFHFLYDLSGQNPIVGFFCPVNESVWEHNKMVVLPPILFWVVFYFWEGENYFLNKDKWFSAALGSVLTMLITIPTLFYFYTEAFGVELIWVDIFLLFLAIVLGQLMGLHIYRYAKGIKWYHSSLILCMIILLYGVFTFYPPHLPLFKDGPTGTYGIPLKYTQSRSALQSRHPKQ